MDNLYNFVNNLRSGIAEADRQANNFINGLGQTFSDAGKVLVLPFQAAGQQIGQWGQQLAQSMGPNTAQAASNQQNTVQPQATQGAAATVNAAPTMNATPITQGAGQAMANIMNAPANTGKTYYVRDPAIDNFINTWRFVMNPLRGITGWTPLDILGDTMSDSMYSTFGKKVTPQETKTEQPKEEEKKEETTTEDEGEYVTYTYKPGDTFGQVILDLGLGTGKGLWGTGGDVDYYTKQLIDQGIWGDNIPKNIPIGTTIKLKRRKI